MLLCLRYTSRAPAIFLPQAWHSMGIARDIMGDQFLDELSSLQAPHGILVMLLFSAAISQTNYNVILGIKSSWSLMLGQYHLSRTKGTSGCRAATTSSWWKFIEHYKPFQGDWKAASEGSTDRCKSKGSEGNQKATK